MVPPTPYVHTSPLDELMTHSSSHCPLSPIGPPQTSPFIYLLLFTGHGTTDWFQIGKGVCQGCILSPCLFNLYAEYIMRNAGLEETQAGIEIAGRNINNLRYAHDTTLMAESEEELKSLLRKVKVESEKVGLKLNSHKKKIMVRSSGCALLEQP